MVDTPGHTPEGGTLGPGLAHAQGEGGTGMIDSSHGIIHTVLQFSCNNKRQSLLKTSLQ